MVWTDSSDSEECGRCGPAEPQERLRVDTEYDDTDHTECDGDHEDLADDQFLGGLSLFDVPPRTTYALPGW